MDNPLLFQILLVLVGLFVIFLTYMNTKTWRWVHVMFSFLTFCAAIAFCLYAALVLKTRTAWIGYHDRLEKEVATLEKDLDVITIGELGDVKETVPSIVTYREEIGRTILDRGRVWKDCGVTVNPDGTFTLTTAPAAPAPAAGGAAPAAAAKNNLAVKDILFAFKNGLEPGGLNVPMIYLGEFQATAVTDGSVTLSPTLPPSAEQAAAARDPAGTWTLYETCPIDGHNWFAGLDRAGLQALIPQSATGLAPADYDKLIEQFARTDQPADEATDPPDNIWMEVKFKQDYKVPVDAAVLNAVDADPFNTDGQAQRERLRVAPAGDPPGEVEFEIGNTAILDRATAENLIQQGIVDKVQPVYRRRLNDFELRFHGIHGRIVEINDRVRLLNLDLASINASKAKADEQAALQDALKAKLLADKAKLDFEKAELTRYGDALAARLAAVRGELSNLYRSNKALSRELAALNARMTDEINRRTGETALNQ
jgi:hypothetical protein